MTCKDIATCFVELHYYVSTRCGWVFHIREISNSFKSLLHILSLEMVSISINALSIESFRAWAYEKSKSSSCGIEIGTTHWYLFNCPSVAGRRSSHCVAGLSRAVP